MRLGAQALSNMLYGFAVLSFNPGPLFFSVVARGVRWQLQDFSPQVSWLFTLLIMPEQLHAAAWQPSAHLCGAAAAFLNRC